MHFTTHIQFNASLLNNYSDLFSSIAPPNSILFVPGSRSVLVFESFAEALFTNWTSLLPNTKLAMLSDTIITTCAHLNLYGKDILLRGQLSIGYNRLGVRMIMTTHYFMFSPGPGQAICHQMLSSLMTHERSDCDQSFCAVPTTCNYLGNKVITTQPNLWQYDFICICGQPICNEILLWLRPNYMEGQFNSVSLCEFGFRLYWLVCL